MRIVRIAQVVAMSALVAVTLSSCASNSCSVSSSSATNDVSVGSRLGEMNPFRRSVSPRATGYRYEVANPSLRRNIAAAPMPNRFANGPELSPVASYFSKSAKSQSFTSRSNARTITGSRIASVGPRTLESIPDLKYMRSSEVSPSIHMGPAQSYATEVVKLKSSAEFDAQIPNRSGRSAVVFTAKWCGPCRSYKPKFVAMAKQRSPERGFYLVDYDKVPDLARRYGVRALPTTIIFESGREVERHEGGLPTSTLLSALNLPR